MRNAVTLIAETSYRYLAFVMYTHIAASEFGRALVTSCQPKHRHQEMRTIAFPLVHQDHHLLNYLLDASTGSSAATWTACADADSAERRARGFGEQSTHHHEAHAISNRERREHAHAHRRLRKIGIVVAVVVVVCNIVVVVEPAVVVCGIVEDTSVDVISLVDDE